MAGSVELQSTPHRRFNPLTREWVLVSPHRTQRPWQGQVEPTTPEQAPGYDPGCYLCPGNRRAGDHQNPKYTDTFVFDNDFAALKLDVPSIREDAGGKGLLVAETEAGICRVVCFSPRHDLTLSRMTTDDVTRVVEVWAEQCQDLGGRDELNYVQIFENRGAMMGCSNMHPHGQIWASGTIPNEPAKEQTALKQHSASKGGCLLCDYLALELKAGDRIVVANEDFVVLVPYWAVWPFEVLLLPRRHTGVINAFSSGERRTLADILRRITSRYDKLFNVSFPYSMGFHQSPTDGIEHPEWHFHGHFYPPLLRSATIRKFMVGYEMLGSPQRDITPESAASRLREMPEVP